MTTLCITKDNVDTVFASIRKELVDGGEQYLSVSEPALSFEEIETYQSYKNGTEEIAHEDDFLLLLKKRGM